MYLLSDANNNNDDDVATPAYNSTVIARSSSKIEAAGS
jgi:hypothetical protein